MGEINDNASLLIGICDDEMHIYNTVDKLLSIYAEKNNMVCHLVYYDSAKKLLEAKDKLDLLLLDIEMPEMDGIEAAFKLRDRGIEYKIVMLTAREDRYRDAFKIGAFRFVPKPIEEKELYKALDDVREHLIGSTKVTVFRDGVAYQIMQRDIVYVEADRSATLVFTKDYEYRSGETLSAWVELLDNRMFFQCHKSYIVNMGKIEEIEKSTISMVTGDKVKVSRRLRTALLNAFMTYDTSRR